MHEINLPDGPLWMMLRRAARRFRPDLRSNIQSFVRDVLTAFTYLSDDEQAAFLANELHVAAQPALFAVQSAEPRDDDEPWPPHMGTRIVVERGTRCSYCNGEVPAGALAIYHWSGYRKANGEPRFDICCSDSCPRWTNCPVLWVRDSRKAKPFRAISGG